MGQQAPPPTRQKIEHRLSTVVSELSCVCICDQPACTCDPSLNLVVWRGVSRFSCPPMCHDARWLLAADSGTD